MEYCSFDVVLHDLRLDIPRGHFGAYCYVPVDESVPLSEAWARVKTLLQPAAWSCGQAINGKGLARLKIL
jgi:hypothetical protein